jgi:predicted nucleic acid-binding protein
MVIYLDTSAILAILYDNDAAHQKASEKWLEIARQGDEVICNNYVFIEAFSLLQRRYGLEKARALQEQIEPLISISWVDEDLHETAVNLTLTANRRNLSVVDCSSFETMRRLGIETVFTFDEHFKERGFQVVP